MRKVDPSEALGSEAREPEQAGIMPSQLPAKTDVSAHQDDFMKRLRDMFPYSPQRYGPGFGDSNT